jgi:23S rRNA pseudouridine1911/1915/1917 synthase
VEKVYWAIVEGVPDPPEGECVDWLRKNEHNRKVQVVGMHSPGAQEARLSYRTLSRAKAGRLVEIRLETGRKHQVRVQLAHRGHAILGDKKYGARTPFPSGIALHARSLELTHPVRKTPLHLTAPLPVAWRESGIDASQFS